MRRRATTTLTAYQCRLWLSPRQVRHWVHSRTQLADQKNTRQNIIEKMWHRTMSQSPKRFQKRTHLADPSKLPRPGSNARFTWRLGPPSQPKPTQGTQEPWEPLVTLSAGFFPQMRRCVESVCVTETSGEWCKENRTPRRGLQTGTGLGGGWSGECNGRGFIKLHKPASCRRPRAWPRGVLRVRCGAGSSQCEERIWPIVARGFGLFSVSK